MKRARHLADKGSSRRIPWWLDVVAVLLTGGILLSVVVWYRLCAAGSFPSR